MIIFNVAMLTIRDQEQLREYVAGECGRETRIITDEAAGPRPGNVPPLTELSRKCRTGAIVATTAEATLPVKDMGTDHIMMMMMKSMTALCRQKQKKSALMRPRRRW